MDDSKDIEPPFFYGTPVKMGQECPSCEVAHYCDAVCLRFKPRIFQCLGCGEWKRHRPMDKLVAEKQMSNLLNGGD